MYAEHRRKDMDKPLEIMDPWNGIPICPSESHPLKDSERNLEILSFPESYHAVGARGAVPRVPSPCTSGRQIPHSFRSQRAPGHVSHRIGDQIWGVSVSRWVYDLGYAWRLGLRRRTDDPSFHGKRGGFPYDRVVFDPESTPSRRLGSKLGHVADSGLTASHLPRFRQPFYGILGRVRLLASNAVFNREMNK